MKLAESLGKTCNVTGVDDPKLLYPLVMAELRQGLKAKGSNQYQTLWSAVSPTGNIYRYNGLLAERRKHCEDLRLQAMEIADTYAHLLGGASNTPQERLSVLLKALGEVQLSAPSTKQNELVEAPPDPGFPPLQEYIGEEVIRFGPILQPADAQARSHHHNATCMAFIVFLIQVLAPCLVFTNRWHMKTNYLRDPHALWARLSFAEAMCLGRTPQEQMTTVMGVCLITVIIFVVRLYVAEEIENAVKSSRLPTDQFWMPMGMIANMWCCVLTVLAVPLLFWSEETPTNIVLDSMTLLFIFKLDDLSELLGGLLRMTESEFQRAVSWNAALIGQCPVRVSDVINPNAKSLNDLWCIKFDSMGHLLMAAQPGRETPGLCETRLSPISASENCQLLRGQPVGDADAPVSSARLRYHQSPQHSTELPTFIGNTMYAAWICLSRVLSVLQFVVPPLWFVVSKPCY